MTQPINRTISDITVQHYILPRAHKLSLATSSAAADNDNDNDNDNNGEGEGLQEFTPIIDTILQSEVKYYSFSVNTQSGVGDFYQLLIFLSGNICNQPQGLIENSTSLAVYYSFNASMFENNEIGEMRLFENGFFQAIANLPVTNTDNDHDGDNDDSGENVMYIAVRAPENLNTTAQWTYQIGVSQNDLVFQWDDRSWGSIVDTDDTSALIVTGNLSNSDASTNYTMMNASADSQFSLYLYSYDYKDYFKGMNNSWCAVRNGPVLIKPENVESSFTSRHGGVQQQFMVNGLNSSTKYIAYLIADFQGTEYGGAVYHPFEFETMDGDACELIYDLDFCDRVAYSVPAIGNHDLLDNVEFGNDNKNFTKRVYDDYAKSLYVNFSKGLQQIACDTEPDAIYSNLRTCADCAESYKDWLCSVSIPRCNTRNQTGYILRNETNQRNDFLADTIQPIGEYYEVLPCVNVCHAIVRDCPSDFGFMCPTTNDSIKLSYYWDMNLSSQWPTCNYVGEMKTATSGGYRDVINWSLFSVLIVSMFII
ncbi:Stretch-activated cation channel, putative [Candida maltosa Xu316]|uniref:Stretch-activated cation channel, putative n=1 Tax=Candida maltosa (strain Xu316) TaxID=1245528 RepID=M3HGL9_CANMX|nr:Stretch-activated cation channel, putative [Candida maltosa Xu316]